MFCHFQNVNNMDGSDTGASGGEGGNTPIILEEKFTCSGKHWNVKLTDHGIEMDAQHQAKGKFR